MEDRPSGKIIGIDLGTTNSVVAYLDESTMEPVVIPNQEGNNKTPSIVAFTEDGDVLVGEIARRQLATNTTGTITAIKRLMGRYYSDVEEGGEEFPFEVANEEDQILISIRGIGYTPQQISGLILKKLKDSAEEYLGEPLKKAIITVPANFDDLQREATIEAGRLAGLEVERLVNEPTAAAMAYGLGKSKEEVVAIYDFGGGTFDISILEVARNAFEVLTTMGDSHLGGEDIDQILVGWLAKDFKDKHGIDLLADPLTFRRVKDAVEKAKCELSTAEQTMINVPFVAQTDQGPLHLEHRLSRDEFEARIQPIVERTIECSREALRDVGLSKKDIDKVILVGGSSRIPLVQDTVAEHFDLEPFKGVNPDEIVALGAATQGGVMSGHLEEVILLEVTPHSLGIEVKNNRISRIIEKNSTIPIKAAKTFTTTEDGQEMVHIHVLQGEESEANQNRSLGRFTLSGIQSGPAGTPRIRVTFFINSDGVVEISAQDLQSGEEQNLTVVHSFVTDEEYRAGRRAASREARRRKRRPRKRTSSLLQGKSIDKKAKAAPPEADATPVAPGEFSGFMEVEPESPASTGQEILAETPSEFHGVRVAQSVMSTPEPTALPTSPEAPPQTPEAAAPPAEAPAAVEQAGEAAPEEPAVVPAKAAAKGPAREAVRAASSEEVDTREPEVAKGPPAPVVEIALVPLLTDQQPNAPEAIRRAAELLDQKAEGEESEKVYREAADEINRILSLNPDVPLLYMLSAALQIQLQNPEAANGAIEYLRKLGKDDVDPVLWLYSRLIERYPQYVPALRGRGEIYCDLGRTDEAISDFEAAVARETSDERTLGVLEGLYKGKLHKAANPALEFKMVKLYLKTTRLDDAISILQRLVNDPNYEQRALKILGLCFWQKNMYYLAWQKFKQLPVTDDIKDILYRLATDMESADQLTNAKYALERILESDFSYMDVEARLKRLNHRLRVQQEELAQTKIPASSEILHDTRFVILDEINRGSMGVVYRARDKVLDEIVAIKVLNDYLCADPQAVQRFKREARAAKRLSHPNIVRIHEFYESGGKKFISMEFIEGRDFKTILLESGRLPPQDAQRYFMQMCEALQSAHQLDIVHRDIKPANVMITTQNMVKITDFGIAKILKSEDVTRSSSMIMGTPLYMAPEQIEGGTIDGRCDIYSLGIMLYESVAGQPPFTEGNIEYHHVNTPVPPLPDDVPAQLKTIIYRCVEKSLEDRFQTPEELRVALNELEA